MRIIAGTARGRPLKGPKSIGLRPTADRVRESVFNILGQWLDGLAVLDLFAGTGALGLEALSRGARRVVLVDSGKEALRLCRDNCAALGFVDRTEIVAGAVTRSLLSTLSRRGSFDLVFADPPYADFSPPQLLEMLEAPGILADGAWAVLEHDRRQLAPERQGPLTRCDTRRFGDTDVSFYRHQLASAPQGP